MRGSSNVYSAHWQQGANLRINGELSVAGNIKALDNSKTTEWDHVACKRTYAADNFNPATKN